jgi:hypothetical protein
MGRWVAFRYLTFINFIFLNKVNLAYMTLKCLQQRDQTTIAIYYGMLRPPDWKSEGKSS